MVHVACRSDTDTHHLLLLFRYWNSFYRTSLCPFRYLHPIVTVLLLPDTDTIRFTWVSFCLRILTQLWWNFALILIHFVSSGHLRTWVILTHTTTLIPLTSGYWHFCSIWKSTLLSDTHTLYVSDIYLRVLTPSLLRTFCQPTTVFLPFRCWHPWSQRGYFRVCRYLHTHPVTYSTSLDSRKYYHNTIETLLCSVQILNFQSKHYASGYWHTISRWSCRIFCSDTEAWVPHFYTLVDCLFGPWYISSFLRHVAFKPITHSISPNTAYSSSVSTYRLSHPSLSTKSSFALAEWSMSHCSWLSTHHQFPSCVTVELYAPPLEWSSSWITHRTRCSHVQSSIILPFDDRLSVPRLIAKQSLDVSCFVHVVPSRGPLVSVFWRNLSGRSSVIQRFS